MSFMQYGCRRSFLVAVQCAPVARARTKEINVYATFCSLTEPCECRNESSELSFVCIPCPNCVKCYEGARRRQCLNWH